MPNIYVYRFERQTPSLFFSQLDSSSFISCLYFSLLSHSVMNISTRGWYLRQIKHLFILGTYSTACAGELHLQHIYIHTHTYMHNLVPIYTFNYRYTFYVWMHTCTYMDTQMKQPASWTTRSPRTCPPQRTQLPCNSNYSWYECMHECMLRERMEACIEMVWMYVQKWFEGMHENCMNAYMERTSMHAWKVIVAIIWMPDLVFPVTRVVSSMDTSPYTIPLLCLFLHLYVPLRVLRSH